MYYTWVRLRNVGPFTDASWRLERGSVGIFGPNGAGKSSLLNFMYALLTNDFTRFDGVKLDCIRATAGEKEESFISGELEHNGCRLSITRRLRGRPLCEVRVDGGKPITDVPKGQAEIERVLGVDGNLLKLYVFKSQDRIYDFLSAAQAERARSFAVLCRTERCEAIWDALGRALGEDADVHAVVEDNSDELARQLDQLRGQVAELDAAAAAAAGRLLNARSEASARAILQRQLLRSELREQWEMARGRREELVRQRDALRRQADERGSATERLQRECAAARQEAEEAAAALRAWDAYEKHRQRRRDLKLEAESLKREEAMMSPPSPPAFRWTDATELQRCLARLEQELEQARRTVAIFDESGRVACPVCGTPVDQLHDHLERQRRIARDHPAVIQERRGEATALAEYERALRRYEKWQAGFAARVRANREALESLPDMTAPDGDREQLKAVVAAQRRRLADLDEAQASWRRAVDAYQRAEADVAALDDQLAKLEERLAANEEPEELVERARRRLAEHAEAREEVARLQGERRGLLARIESLEDELRRLRVRLRRQRRARSMARVAEAARDVLHRDRLPRRVALANLARLVGDINDGLAHFGSPFWVEVEDDLSFRAHRPGLPPLPAGRLSTGQRVVLALAFWTAVASLWQHDLGMLALDEPTAHLDAENRRYLAQALGAMSSRVRGRRQIIMVTHDPDLRSSFDQVIELGG
jgi:DNA repair exonuclease SbcCD ATPase subunit